MALPEWLEIVPTSGAGDAVLELSAQEHTGREARSATVSGTPDGGTPDTLEVIQEGKSAYVSLLTSGVLTVPASGGSVALGGMSNAVALMLQLESGAMPEPSRVNLLADSYSTDLEDPFNPVQIEGDPGADAEYVFRYGMTFPERFGRAEIRGTLSVADAAIIPSSNKSGLVRLSQEGAAAFITRADKVPSLSINANGKYPARLFGEGNIGGIGLLPASGSNFTSGAAMKATLTVTGKSSGTVKTVELTESGKVYPIPDDPGLDEAYEWELLIQQWPENTGWSDKSGKWLIGDADSTVEGPQLSQGGAQEFCEVETEVLPTYSFPKLQEGTISIKGRSNSTCVFIRYVSLSATPSATMLINGEEALEWEPGNAEIGNIALYRGRYEAYEWEIRLLVPALPGSLRPQDVSYVFGWTPQDAGGNSINLGTFVLKRT